MPLKAKWVPQKISQSVGEGISIKKERIWLNTIITIQTFLKDKMPFRWEMESPQLKEIMKMTAKVNWSEELRAANFL